MLIEEVEKEIKNEGFDKQGSSGALIFAEIPNDATTAEELKESGKNNVIVAGNVNTMIDVLTDMLNHLHAKREELNDDGKPKITGHKLEVINNEKEN